MDRKKIGSGVTTAVLGGVRDVSYIFQSILIKANILAYCSCFVKSIPIKRVCPFKGILRVDFSKI